VQLRDVVPTITTAVPPVEGDQSLTILIISGSSGFIFVLVLVVFARWVYKRRKLNRIPSQYINPSTCATHINTVYESKNILQDDSNPSPIYQEIDLPPGGNQKNCHIDTDEISRLCTGHYDNVDSHSVGGEGFSDVSIGSDGYLTVVDNEDTFLPAPLYDMASDI
jgi:hypothetical protein